MAGIRGKAPDGLMPTSPPSRRRRLTLSLLISAAFWGCTDNRAPVFEPLVDQHVTVGEVLRVPVRAFDRDGDGVGYRIRGLPPAARFVEGDPATLTWSPVASEARPGGRPWPITFIAEDDLGAQSEGRLIIYVHPGQTQPTFTSPAAFVMDARVQAEWDVLITVRDDDDVTLDLKLVEAPEGMRFETFDKAARLRWRPTPSQLLRQRIFPVTVSAQDDDGAPTLHPMTLLVLPPEPTP